jgi:hypothetical protein
VAGVSSQLLPYAVQYCIDISIIRVILTSFARNRRPSDRAPSVFPLTILHLIVWTLDYIPTIPTPLNPLYKLELRLFNWQIRVCVLRDLACAWGWKMA